MTEAQTKEAVIAELVDRHRALYQSSEVDQKLQKLIHTGPFPQAPAKEILALLRQARAVFFDTHVAVVSGHHTSLYLRFESVAGMPGLMTFIANHMAAWILDRFVHHPVTGILTTASAAQQLAERVGKALEGRMPLRVVHTAFEAETGRIGTYIVSGRVERGDRLLALNDVTTRGNCVSKLGKVVMDHGGDLAGMTVFARRDSGQFPLMHELTAKYPFYYTADLEMPQWEPADCPMCRQAQPLLSWRDMPDL